MKIAVAYRSIPQSPGWAIGESLICALRRLGHDVWPVTTYYKKDFTRWDYRPENIDLAIHLEMADGDRFLHVRAPITVYWEFDTALHEDYTKQLVSEYKFNRVFLANKRYLKLIPLADYLPLAIDETMLPHPVAYGDKHGVACVGSSFKERVEFANKLCIPFQSGIYRREYFNFIANLKICVNAVYSGGNGLLTQRFFEALGCGTMLVTENQREIHDEFDDQRHLVTFNTIDDAKRHIEHFLNNPEKLKRIARDGREHVLKNHTFLNRAKEILKCAS